MAKKRDVIGCPKFNKINLVFFAFFVVVFGTFFVSAASILDQLHLNIQTTDISGNVITGTYNFVFNISTTSDCLNVVYSNSTSLTTDSRGIISYYLENTGLNYSDQYYLCYYRNNVLIDNAKIARTPYSFNAQNTTLSGMAMDTNLNLGSYNATATYYFGSGKYLTDIDTSALNLSQVNYWTKSGNNLYYNSGNVGIGTTNTSLGKLVVSATTSNDLLTLQNTNAYGWLSFRESSTVRTYFGYDGGGNIATNTLAGSTVLRALTTGLHLIAGSDATNGMTILNGGNVGIGTTTPNYTLDINGNFSIKTTSFLIGGNGDVNVY